MSVCLLPCKHKIVSFLSTRNREEQLVIKHNVDYYRRKFGIHTKYNISNKVRYSYFTGIDRCKCSPMFLGNIVTEIMITLLNTCVFRLRSFTS